MTIKELKDVENIEVDTEESELFIEAEDGSGICIEISPIALMHLLDKYTDKEYGPDKIYGIERIDGLDEEW